MAFRKATKEETNYRSDQGNVLETCGSCLFFNKLSKRPTVLGRCFVVEGRIRPEDTCDLFTYPIPEDPTPVEDYKVVSDTGGVVIDTPRSRTIFRGGFARQDDPRIREALQ